MFYLVVRLRVRGGVPLSPHTQTLDPDPNQSTKNQEGFPFPLGRHVGRREADFFLEYCIFFPFRRTSDSTDFAIYAIFNI